MTRRELGSPVMMQRPVSFGALERNAADRHIQIFFDFLFARGFLIPMAHGKAALFIGGEKVVEIFFFVDADGIAVAKIGGLLQQMILHLLQNRSRRALQLRRAHLHAALYAGGRAGAGRSGRHSISRSPTSMRSGTPFLIQDQLFSPPRRSRESTRTGERLIVEANLPQIFGEIFAIGQNWTRASLRYE